MSNTKHIADKTTNAYTAFSTYAALTAACQGGYVPTLSKGASWLGRWLESDGFKVFWRA